MIEKIKQSRLCSYILIIFMYLIAAAVGFFVFSMNHNGQDVLFLFLADLAATVVIWLFGVLFQNSSIYDPYWSVAPMVLLTALAYYYGVFSTPSILMLIAIWFWSARLTVNWMFTFPNLYHQDWRYTRLKSAHAGMWQLINFTGIHLFPTIIVFMAMIPAFYLLKIDTPANLATYAAYAICIGAVILQWVSDMQMHHFRKRSPGIVCNTGLWKYSRHPNYLGEIIFWWGIYLFLLSVSPGYWWTIFGPLCNNLMFIYISIPMMEKRQMGNKPGYAGYMESTNMLLPLFKNKK